RTIEKTAHGVAADLASCDGHVIGRARDSQAVGALQADRIIERGIDGAVRDTDIPAAVDVEAIAVRIDFDVADRHVIHAGCQQHEPSTLKNGEVFEVYISTELQRDGLVSLPLCRASISQQSASPDPSRSQNRNILKLLSVDQTVAPMAMAEV